MTDEELDSAALAFRREHPAEALTLDGLAALASGDVRGAVLLWHAALWQRAAERLEAAVWRVLGP